MNIQIQRTAKMLNQGDRTGVRRGICITRFVGQVCGNGAILLLSHLVLLSHAFG